MTEPRIEWLTEDANGIHYSQSTSPTLMAIGLTLGLWALAGIAVGLNGLFSQPDQRHMRGNVAIFLLCLGFPVAAGCLVIVSFQPQRFSFNRTSRRLTGLVRGPFPGLLSAVDIEFARLDQLLIRHLEIEDMNDRFRISLGVLGGRSIEIGDWEDFFIAATWAKRIHGLISGNSVSGPESGRPDSEHPSQGTET